ncbi:CoA transferase [Nonomuraea wenchangensis]
MSAGPLSGLTIVDFTRLIAGPCAGDLLGAMGAEVVKVEDAKGDPMRGARSRRAGQGLTAPSFAAYNVHKSSVVLDLKDPRGRAAALRLCERADAVISAFRPGVMERLGLGARDLRARNPRLVVGRLSAFGETGPERDRGGVDIVLQAESGLMSVTGTPDGPPLKVGVPIIDAASAYVLALGVVGALLGRERGTDPGDVSVSMLDVGLHLQAQALAEYLESGAEPERAGNSAPYAAPADVFMAADGPLVLSAHLPQHWARLCDLLERPQWHQDQRFSTVDGRVAHREELTALIEEVLAQQPAAHWLGLFAAAGLTAGRIRTYAQVTQDPVVEATDVDGSTLRVIRTPLRFSGWDDTTLSRRIPRTGEHTTTILGKEET